MNDAVRLIPLMCPRCQAMLPANVEEVAWVCSQCGQASLLDDAKGALAIDAFFSAAIPQNGTGFPYWVTRGAVSIAQRQTYSGDQSRAMNEFWSTPHLFYIPAWQLAINDLVSAGSKLLRNPLRMEKGSTSKIYPVVLPQRDVRPLAEFIVMSIEAERSDALKQLDFKIQLDPIQLWVLP
jgi:hypothetical protein